MKVCRAYCVYVCMIVLGALLLSSCGVAVRDKLRQGLDLAFNPVPQAVGPDALAEGRASGLMLFGASLLSYGKYLGGGDETLLYDTYLGCLTCGEFEFDSVFNEQGTYGVAYSRWSIRNTVGQYGGREAFYNLSACNPAADVPPVVADHTGTIYGVLNVSHRQMTRAYGIRWQNRYSLSTLRDWLTEVCAVPPQGSWTVV